MNQKVKTEYAVVLAEDVTLYPMSTHTVSVFIAEYGNDILPTFLEPTAFLMESILEQRGDEAFLVPSTLLIATGAKAYNWILLNKLNAVLTLPQGHQLGKAVLQSHTIASISALPNLFQDLSIKDAIQQQLTNPIPEAEHSEDEDSFSSMPPLELIEDSKEALSSRMASLIGRNSGSSISFSGSSRSN